MSLPEKYRPQSLSEVVGHDDIIEALVKFKKTGQIPNLLFVGAAGTGKTTIAQLFIKYLFKNEFRNNYLELNASDDNGIEVVRTKVKDFASKKSINSVFPRIVFLDEVDRLTAPAQEALKKPMEAFSKTARFILCANSDNIHAALRSRCICFTFTALTDEAIKNRVMQVIDAENIQISDAQVGKIVKNASGDLRQALNLLHATVSGVELAEEIVNYKLLDMSVKEFEDKILYKYDGNKIINKLFSELIKKGIYDKMSILATADYRLSLQTVKTLQILDAFMQIKGE